MKELNQTTVREASEYIEKFEDNTERDFALSHMEGFLSRYGQCLKSFYDPISNKLHIWADASSGLYETWEDVETPEDIQQLWIEWCRNNPKPYCTQNSGDCATCSLVNYGRDCRNNKI